MAKRLVLTPEHPRYPALSTTLEPGGRELSVGRARGSHLRLDPLVISSRHARLALSEDGRSVHLWDLSRNGIAVVRDGLATPVGRDGPPVGLASGDRVVFVQSRDLEPPTITYAVEIADAPAAPPPPPPASGGGRRRRPPQDDDDGDDSGGGDAGSDAGGRRVRARLAETSEAADAAAMAAQAVQRGAFSPHAGSQPQPVDDAHDDAAPRSLAQRELVVVKDRPFAEDFETLRYLNEGGFAKVYVCRERATGRIYAVKEIDKSKYQTPPDEQQDGAAAASGARSAHDPSFLLSEVKLLHNLKHQHVVRLYQVYDDERHMRIVQVRRHVGWSASGGGGRAGGRVHGADGC